MWFMSVLILASSMVLGFVSMYVVQSVLLYVVSNAFLMSSTTVIVRSGGLFWLKPVAMVLFVLCSGVLVEWLLMKQCCV